MSDEDLWNLVTAFAGMPDDARVDIRTPRQTFLFAASEFRALVDEAWQARGHQPDPAWSAEAGVNQGDGQS